MQAVSRRDTPPELALRSALYRLGLRFRIDSYPIAALRRRADIVFKSAKVAIFVDGCFWHGCPIHGSWPKENANWWREKIERNHSRDIDTGRRLQRAGWRVIRLWEHDDVAAWATRISSAISQRKLAQGGGPENPRRRGVHHRVS